MEKNNDILEPISNDIEKPTKFKLTPAIAKNIEIITERLRRAHESAQQEGTLILDSFAQGCGIQDDQSWTLSEDNQYIIFKPKEENPTQAA